MEGSKIVTDLLQNLFLSEAKRIKEIRAVGVCGPAFLLAVLFEKSFEERRSGYDERTENRSIKVLFPFGR